MNDDTPTVVGVPEIVDPDNTNPAGNDPTDTAHEYAPTPPAAANDCEYAVPVIPTGNDVVTTPSTVPATDTVNAFDAVRLPASVTFTVNDAVVFDAAVGVPDRAPVDAFNVTPSGNDPDTTSHVNGPKPPADTRVCEYATDADAGANDDVDTTSGSTTRTDNTLDALRPCAPVTVTVNDDNPADVGVPDNTPVEEFNDNPAGTPLDTDHVYGVAPPDAVRVCEYTDPVTPSASDDVDTTIGAYTSTVNDCTAVRPSASVTVTANDDDPTTDGVPDNTPVDAFNVTPAGNDPDDTDHAYAPTPPAAANVCEYAVPVTPDGNDVVDTDNAVKATDTDTTCDA